MSTIMRVSGHGNPDLGKTAFIAGMPLLCSWDNCDTIKVRKGLYTMPQIIPIRDLKNTTDISQMCHELSEPIYVTKNGYGDMVIMSMKTYEEKLFLADVYSKLAEAETEVKEGKVLDARKGLNALRERYGL